MAIRTRVPRAISGALLTTLLLVAPAAWASANLALEQGCLKCHGEPPRNKTPSFAQIALDYAPYRGQDQKIQGLAQDLCRQHMFGGVTAHERMAPADAEIFVRWLVDGGK